MSIKITYKGISIARDITTRDGLTVTYTHTVHWPGVTLRSL